MRVNFLEAAFWVVIFVTFILFINYYKEYQCNNYQELTGRESKWVFLDSCYVKKDDGSWIRYDKSFKE